jgi:hypothetical protein
VLAALAAFLVLTHSSAARVVPDACIGGIGLWDNSVTVLEERGPPIRKRHVRPDVWWVYRQGSVLLTPWRASRDPRDLIVLVIRTRDRSERLPTGIGVGSWFSEVRARYPQCPRHGSCDVGGSIDRETVLELDRSRVSRVSVGLDSGFDDGPRQPPDPRCRRS